MNIDTGGVVTGVLITLIATSIIGVVTMYGAQKQAEIRIEVNAKNIELTEKYYKEHLDKQTAILDSHQNRMMETDTRLAIMERLVEHKIENNKKAREE